MVYFVSRHAGARAWVEQQTQWQVDCFISHLDPQCIRRGDVVLGTLPLHLAAEVCARGGIFYFLTLPQEEAGRGSEYSAEEMAEMGCSLRRFEVRAV
ncbi:CRISPR-associated protein Csx16 [Neisseria leonii]|uniref:CRISPR-associated protein Csx16 n=1 Tax=Neisseria leonii TaxID=2995413 RepID=A0A9X4E2I9_9NEIS|nr:CRISPR-associated protein Csx16 [Neisseria sp. 51.81]MDD9326776.1 CRISPR-associated protein Csx16 [Neisseria sp. 51.81]